MLEQTHIAGISEQVKAHDFIDEEVVNALRAAYPDIHFTYCLDDDIINAKPVIEEEKFNIYLVDGREHCLCLTNDYDAATGVVVAEVVDDD